MRRKINEAKGEENYWKNVLNNVWWDGIYSLLEAGWLSVVGGRCRVAFFEALL